MTTWTLTLPWRDMPLSLNDRGGWQRTHSIGTQVKDRTRKLAADAKIPRLMHATVTLVWIVPDKRIRDEENPVPTLKAACDGLKDEVRRGIRLLGIVPDDNPAWMTKRMPIIEYRRGQRAIKLIVEGKPMERGTDSRPPARPLAGAQDSDVCRGRNEASDALRRSEGGAR